MLLLMPNDDIALLVETEVLDMVEEVSETLSPLTAAPGPLGSGFPTCPGRSSQPGPLKPSGCIGLIVFFPLRGGMHGIGPRRGHPFDQQA